MRPYALFFVLTALMCAYGCVATGKQACTHYGVSVPFVFVGVKGRCWDVKTGDEGMHLGH